MIFHFLNEKLRRKRLDFILGIDLLSGDGVIVGNVAGIDYEWLGQKYWIGLDLWDGILSTILEIVGASILTHICLRLLFRLLLIFLLILLILIFLCVSFIIVLLWLILLFIIALHLIIILWFYFFLLTFLSFCFCIGRLLVLIFILSLLTLVALFWFLLIWFLCLRYLLLLWIFFILIFFTCFYWSILFFFSWDLWLILILSLIFPLYFRIFLFLLRVQVFRALRLLCWGFWQIFWIVRPTGIDLCLSDWIILGNVREETGLLSDDLDWCCLSLKFST